MVSVPVLSEQIHEVDPCVNKSVEKKHEKKKNMKKKKKKNMKKIERREKGSNSQDNDIQRVTRKQQQ